MLANCGADNDRWFLSFQLTFRLPRPFPSCSRGDGTVVVGLLDHDLLAMLQLLRECKTALLQSLVESGDHVSEARVRELLQALGEVSPRDSD